MNFLRNFKSYFIQNGEINLRGCNINEICDGWKVGASMRFTGMQTNAVARVETQVTWLPDTVFRSCNARTL